MARFKPLSDEAIRRDYVFRVSNTVDDGETHPCDACGARSKMGDRVYGWTLPRASIMTPRPMIDLCEPCHDRVTSA